jgi:hypothetical protein
MDCSICFEEIKENEKKIIKCNHIFHKECIDKWFKRSHQCPLCRNSKFDIKCEDFEKHYLEEAKKIDELIKSEQNFIFKV